MPIMETGPLLYWILIFGCFYHMESISASSKTCIFENVKCICWHQDNGFHVNCSGKIGKKIPKIDDNVVWLDLSHNNIQEIDPQKLPNRLKYLDLSSNTLTNVKKMFFNSLPELRFLNLSYCSVSHVEEGAFVDLDNLQHLDVSFNRNLGFASLPNLTFGLIKTRISSLQLNGITCKTGTGTTLRRHHLRNIRGTNITELSLDSNRLELFEPGVIGWLPKTLKVFSMANNKLTTGVYLLEFAPMTNLRILNVSLQLHPPKYPLSVLDRCQDKVERQIYDGANDSIKELLENYYNNDYSLNFNWTIPLPPNLETYDAHSSRLYFHVPDFSVHAPNLRHVYLQNNFIISWTGHVQMKNCNILTLDISNNLCSHVSLQSLQALKHARYLNISHNDLGQDLEKDTEGLLFKTLERLEVLDMSFNRISSLPKQILRNSKRIKYINVSNNRLSDWEVSVSGMPNLTLLDLSQNKLTTLDDNARINIERAFKHSNVSIDLSENALACSCENQEFLVWMTESNQHFLNIDNYTCSPPNPRFSFRTLNKSVISLSKSCKSYLGWYVGCAVSLAVFCSFLTSRLLVKNKWKIRYIVYKSKQKFGWVKQPNMQGSTSVNYEHDVFLSYSGCTLMFVLNEVIPRLEGNRNMKLIIRDRDYLPGFPKTDSIMHSLQESRKTVCIVSKKYLESRWRDYELNMAKTEGIVDRSGLDFVILILLPEVYNSGYPRKIMDLVKRNCYIEYPEESCACDDFWNELVDMIES
ncbi:toll-like receptor 4 [Ostrea edulis]|uniref:toll-like receptor 4 n=1 Tax=Ostrea edulis TaxID=37623 RepID=UPI0024AFF11A|nr:toll-like receptor 4 [Ostrea edulis]